MQISNEKKLAGRATELGKSASPEVFGELVKLVRRLAASALGKLSEVVPSEEAVQVSHPARYLKYQI